MSNWPGKIRITVFFIAKFILTLALYAIMLIGLLYLVSMTPYFNWKPIVTILIICVVVIPLTKVLWNSIFKKILILFGQLIGLKKEDFKGTKYYKRIQDYEDSRDHTSNQ